MKYFPLLFIVFFASYINAQTINTIAGTGIAGFSGDNGPAINAAFKNPNYIIIDKAGNKYICDVGNRRIRKVNTVGIITTVAGNGTTAYSGDNGSATAAGLCVPVGVAVDTSGNLYISTAGDHRIRKVNTSGIITTIAGTGTPGYNGDGIPATDAQLFYPYMGKVDEVGNVYFSDYNNHRVRKISPSGIITTVAGNGTNAYSGDGGPATNAGIPSPSGSTIGPDGALYIPDNGDHRIRKVSAAGIITTFAGTGIAGDNGDNGPATDAQLSLPNTIALDRDGNAYIADAGANKIRRIDALTGIITTAAGTGEESYGGDGGPATNAMLNQPNHVTTDNVGNVYIADYNNHRIRRINYDINAVNDVNPTLIAVEIYPNPVQGAITVSANTIIEDAEIVNILGKRIVSMQPLYDKHEIILSVAALPSGIYMVKINGKYAGKFVKE